MKKTSLAVTLLVISLFSFSQRSGLTPVLTFKWSPAGLVLGSVAIQSEYNVGGRNSITAKVGVPVQAHHTLSYKEDDAAFSMKAFSLLAGYRRYFSKKHLRGVYLEPYLTYVKHTTDGVGNSTLHGLPVVMSFSNDFKSAGIGAQVGAQFFIGKRIVIDLFFLGPQINSAATNFIALETTSALPWTDIQANEAEKDIHDFINKFPFIKNKTIITVDKNNRTVTADFKGGLPGFRAGVSLGIAL